MDPLLLARIQFAANITFHILFPTISIALGWALLYFKPRHNRLARSQGLPFTTPTPWLQAYRWRRGDRSSDVRLTMRPGATVAALLIPLQIAVGDLHGLNTLEHQPAKIAAIEALWQTHKGAPMTVFGMPNVANGLTRYAIKVPKLASLVLTHQWDGEVKGLDAFAGKHPPVAPIFFSFRLMVGIGLLMLAVSWVGWWQLRPNSRRPDPASALTWALLALTFSGWLTEVAGWYTTKIGRQPWLVYGVLTMAQAAGRVPAPALALTLSICVTLHLALTAAYVAAVFRLARQGAGAEPPRLAADTLRPERRVNPA